MIGFVVVIYNDLDLSQKMYPSFEASMLENESHILVCIDGFPGGSTDGSLEFWQSKSLVFGPHAPQHVQKQGYSCIQLQHLSVCLNLGYAYLLKKGAEHVAWIHPDMLFPQKGWATYLKEYLAIHPDVGLACATQTKNKEKGERFGYQQAQMWPRHIIYKLRNKDGYFYDENYKKIGGYEDWDVNRRVVELRYKVMITPTAIVTHPAMGTRGKRNTVAEQQSNAAYFFKKWGSNKWASKELARGLGIKC